MVDGPAGVNGQVVQNHAKVENKPEPEPVQSQLHKVAVKIVREKTQNHRNAWSTFLAKGKQVRHSQ